MTEPLTIRFPTAVDNTMMSAYQSCPQKALIEFLMQKSPQGKSVHLHAGGAFAHALEVFRHHYYAERYSYDDALNLAFMGFMQFWKDYESPETESKDFVNMWMAVERYFQEFPPETDEFQPFIKVDGTPAVEFTFAIPTHVNHPDTGDPILYAGRADMIAVARGSLYVMDEKTTKAMGPSWPYQWDMRGQFFGYVKAAQLMGFDCSAALVRGIAIYKERDYAFASKPILYTKKSLDRWWLNLHQRLRYFVEDYKLLRDECDNDPDIQLEVLQRSYGDACTAFGGCQFRDVCTSDNSRGLVEMLEKRTWDPLDKDPTKAREISLASTNYSLEELMA